MTVNFPLDRRALSYWSTLSVGLAGVGRVRRGQGRFSSRDLPLRSGLPVGAGRC